jgi:hypothetical protein
MMDVQKQENGSDCGVLAIAITYDLCAGHDPGQVQYNSKRIRPHLEDCLQNLHFSHFPTNVRGKTGGVLTSTTIDLFCTCRMPEEDGVEMAECEACKKWYRKRKVITIPELLVIKSAWVLQIMASSCG